MRKFSIIAAVLIVAVLMGAGAAVYAYDSSREDRIANGVRVGSTDVGGLTATKAEAKLRRALLGPLQRPLIIEAGAKTFPLSAKEARIRANIAGMVDDAVRRSRDGSFVGRAWRDLTGGEVDATVRPRIEFSRAAVQRIVDRVRVTMSRPAQDAKVDFATSSLTIRPSRVGRTIDSKALRAGVLSALVRPSGDRSIRAKLRRVEPKVSGEKLANRYPVVVTVDRGAHRLRLFKDLRPAKSYPIALGQAGLETPAGLYNIANKAVNPAWTVPDSDWAGSLRGQVIPGGTPQNPLKARWLGVYDGVGVHGTSDRGSIGTNASHGCIRMYIEDVIELYDQVPVGAPIYIA